MANFTQNQTTDLASSSAEPRSTCLDRYQTGVDNGELTVLTEASYVLVIIVNSMAALCTVVINALVIGAVKRRPRLQSETNILLACLAGTDLLCGLAAQPSFVFWKAFQLSGVTNNCMLREIHNAVFRFVPVLSLIHLLLVTGERLVAIKFTLRYRLIVTTKNIRVAVITVWVWCIMNEAGRAFTDTIIAKSFSSFLALVLIGCMLFILTSYVILFREIRHHQKAIKAQRLSQDEVERHTRDDKAFKTTVYIVGAMLISFLPMALALLFRPEKGYGGLFDVFLPWFRTFAMLNSLCNPLIYCWRQKEMRDFILKMFSSVIHPSTDNF